MIKVIAVMVLILTIGSTSYSEEISKKDKIESAVLSINRWLQSVDAGEYATSWDSASSFFKSQLTNEKWVDALTKVRVPLGENIRRKRNGAAYKTALPGVPDGEYVVVVFKSGFEKKKRTEETVTALYEDSSWKVAGYFIK